MQRDDLQSRPRPIPARPERQVQADVHNVHIAPTFPPKPGQLHIEEAMQPTQALKRRLDGSPPRIGVPRQPPPTSLDEIHNNQMFRQRSEGRENPVLPPKPPMPRKGSKQSLVHAVRRKTSETTDPEVWGSDFQEVVTEDTGRMVAIYSYNGEEPGTLQIQPGQQFRLVG